MKVKLNKCFVCKQTIIDNKKVRIGKKYAHLLCYRPDVQEDKDVKQYNITFSGETSPYWKYLSDNCYFENESGLLNEPYEANPDKLPGIDENLNVSQATIKDDKIEAINEVYKKLPKVEKTILDLMYFENLTETEVSQRLGISHQRVFIALSRIRQKVFKKYGSKLSKNTLI